MKNSGDHNSIFLEQDLPKSESDQEIYYQRSSGDNQNQYLSQFIENRQSPNLQSIFQPKSEQPPNPVNSMNQEQSDLKLEKENHEIKGKKRNIIKVKKCTKPKEPETIAYEMWTVFTKSLLYSKKFLYVLFGVYGNDEENQFSKIFLNELGFMEIFAKYSEDMIKEAQKYLRKQVIGQLKNLNIEEYLHYRKLKRVQQFKHYLEVFIEELREGCVRKRLPKDKKMKMEKSQKEKDGSPQTSFGT